MKLINPCNSGSGGASASSVPSGYIVKTNDTGQTTSVLAINTPLKMVATTAIDTDLSNLMTSPSSNRLTSTSTRDFVGNIAVSASGNTSSGAQLRFRIYKNGAALDSSVFDEYVHQNGTYYYGYQIIMKDTISLNDYYEIWLENTLNTSDFVCRSTMMDISFEGWS